MYWNALRELYYETNTKAFKYNKTLEQVEKEMDGMEYVQNNQLTFNELLTE